MEQHSQVSDSCKSITLETEIRVVPRLTVFAYQIRHFSESELAILIVKYKVVIQTRFTLPHF